MEKIKSLTSTRPLIFSFLVTLVFVLMVLITSIGVGLRYPGGTPGWYIGSAVGRAISILILMRVIVRLGWFAPAGFASLGGWRIWVISLLTLVYSIGVSAYAMTGNFRFQTSDPELSGAAILFITAAAVLEEVSFRGLILFGLITAWGETGRALTKSVVVSSIFFGGMHLVNFLGGEPLSEVFIQCIVAFFLGVLLCAIVVYGRSMYPAIVIHSLLNAAGYLNLTSNSADGTISSWLTLSVLMILPAIFGLLLVRRISSPSTALNLPQEDVLIVPE